jgi:hypothetical protein
MVTDFSDGGWDWHRNIMGIWGRDTNINGGIDLLGVWLGDGEVLICVGDGRVWNGDRLMHDMHNRVGHLHDLFLDGHNRNRNRNRDLLVLDIWNIDGSANLVALDVWGRHWDQLADDMGHRCWHWDRLWNSFWNVNNVWLVDGQRCRGGNWDWNWNIPVHMHVVWLRIWDRNRCRNRVHHRLNDRLGDWGRNWNRDVLVDVHILGDIVWLRNSDRNRDVDWHLHGHWHSLWHTIWLHFVEFEWLRLGHRVWCRNIDLCHVGDWDSHLNCIRLHNWDRNRHSHRLNLCDVHELLVDDWHWDSDIVFLNRLVDWYLLRSVPNHLAL